MKKFLLFAAAAVAMSASAQLTIERVYTHNVADLGLAVGDTRQGVGANGKFYIQDKSQQKVVVVGQNGLLDQTFESGANCGITLDEAGNLVVSLATFPNAWVCDGETAALKVINPATGESLDLVIPEDAAIAGRADFLGFAKGNLMEEGEIDFVGATSTGVSRLIVTDGEVNPDESYVALAEGVTMSNMTVINMIGDQILFVTRSAHPEFLTLEGEKYTKETVVLPQKGNSNGAFPFIFGNKNYIAYTMIHDGDHYTDHFAIAEVGAEEIELDMALTGMRGVGNSHQTNWLNVEVVDDNTANLYQYQPGGHCTMWKLSLPSTGVNDLNVKAEKVYKTIENGQVVIVKGNARYNVAGQAIK